MRKPSQEEVALAVKALPMRLRRVFVMRHVLHAPRLEIAAVLHLSVRQVDRRLTKALVACRRRLQRCS